MTIAVAAPSLSGWAIAPAHAAGPSTTFITLDKVNPTQVFYAHNSPAPHATTASMVQLVRSTRSQETHLQCAVWYEGTPTCQYGAFSIDTNGEMKTPVARNHMRGKCTAFI